MKKTPILCLILLFTSLISAQKSFNHSFEKFDPATGLPADWSKGVGPGSSTSYVFAVDSSTAIEGRYSARLASPKEGGEFGAFSRSFPADFEGKTITLKGWIKTENVSQDGFAGLWMRLDGESGVVGFDNMQQIGLNGDNGWRPYTIDLDYSQEAQTIVVGGLLVGSGTAWYDDIEVLVDGKPLLEAPARIVQKIPADLDTAFASGSNVSLGELNEQRVEDLALLGKIWGFLKYHHPKVASGDLNWDFELFRFLKRYPSGLKSQQRDALLVEWIESLGELPDCPGCSKKIEGDVHLTADLKWMDDSKLSAGLRKQLKAVYEHRNQAKHFYIDLDPYIGNPKFLHENPYNQFKYPDEGFRLLSVYRFWNIIQYYFPYRDVIGEDWTGVMREFIPKMAKVTDALSYKLCTRELIGRVHDTHANLWIQDEALRSYFGNLRPAIQVKFIENQAVVTGYYDTEQGPKTGLLPGDVITAIEGVAVEEIVKKKLPLYPASNLPTKLRDIAKDLLRTNDTTLHLKVRRNQVLADFEVACFDANKEKFNLRKDWAHNQPDSCYRLLTPDIGYLFLGNVKSDLLPGIMEKFKDTKGLIVDIRNYPSEFVVFSLTALLKANASEFVYFTNGHVDNPGVFTKTQAIESGEVNPDHYKGKVVVLINEISQSQAEYTTMALRAVPGAVVVGSTTAGADGNISDFMLPGGLRSMISGIGVFYPDGKPTQRVGIVPDHTVLPTIAGVQAGRDELLEFAMKLIEGP
ncbi:MAG: S41 family peptidase [Saprospiraceae bacterium]